MVKLQVYTLDFNGRGVQRSIVGLILKPTPFFFYKVCIGKRREKEMLERGKRARKRQEIGGDPK